MEKPLREPVRSFNGRIKRLHVLISNEKVENPSKETQVFIEVQVIAKYVKRTTSGLLFDDHYTNTYTSRGLENTDGRDAVLRWKLFQINFDDLFAEDVFANCDFGSLFSIGVSRTRSPSATLKFQNSFKRCMSRFIEQKRAKYKSKVKRSSLCFAVTIEFVRVVDVDEEVAIKELESLRVCHRRCNHEKDEAYINKPGSNFQSILETSLMTGLYDNSNVDDDDSNYDDGDTDDEDRLDVDGNLLTKKIRHRCPICSVAYEIGENVMATRCGHLFHNKCLIPWFNTTDTCAVCREPIW